MLIDFKKVCNNVQSSCNNVSSGFNEVFINVLLRFYCDTILLPGRKSACRPGFWPDCPREITEMRPPAGLRLAGGPISVTSRQQSGLHPARKADFWPGSTIAQSKIISLVFIRRHVEIRAGRSDIEAKTKAKEARSGAIQGSGGRIPGPGRMHNNWVPEGNLVGLFGVRF